jgi:hypothetical protein
MEKYLEYDFRKDNDLNVCYKIGFAYQNDMSQSIDYDASYFDHYVNLENTDISIKINSIRTSFTQKYVNCLIDVGIGSGEFIKNSNCKTYGFDINPKGIEWLKQENKFIDIYNEPIPEDVQGWTFWDCLEHIKEHSKIFNLMRKGQYLFLSLPYFENLDNIRDSKHYKPNEHYYYFVQQGLMVYMRDCGFELVEYNFDETKAGRSSIIGCCFKKND